MVKVNHKTGNPLDRDDDVGEREGIDYGDPSDCEDDPVFDGDFGDDLEEELEESDENEV